VAHLLLGLPNLRVAQSSEQLALQFVGLRDRGFRRSHPATQRLLEGIGDVVSEIPSVTPGMWGEIYTRGGSTIIERITGE